MYKFTIIHLSQMDVLFVLHLNILQIIEKTQKIVANGTMEGLPWAH